MTFSQDIARFIAKTEQKLEVVREGIDSECFRSIVDGSDLTGSPGQPVRSGRLKASWEMEQGADETVIASSHKGARAVEENWNNEPLPNGGAHSLELTALGFQRIVSHVVEEVRA